MGRLAMTGTIVVMAMASTVGGASACSPLPFPGKTPEQVRAAMMDKADVIVEGCVSTITFTSSTTEILFRTRRFTKGSAPEELVITTPLGSSCGMETELGHAKASRSPFIVALVKDKQNSGKYIASPNLQIDGLSGIKDKDEVKCPQ